ncbi:MAG TPA: hypothetical protein VH500_23940 [Nitrososphaeraceae archaeon]|jgi:cytochrome bd-type quinol oxidase subunit 1
MVITAPGIALVLFTVPYFLAVIAAIIYTNKKIRKGEYDMDSNESEQQETTT